MSVISALDDLKGLGRRFSALVSACQAAEAAIPQVDDANPSPIKRCLARVPGGGDARHWWQSNALIGFVEDRITILRNHCEKHQADIAIADKVQRAHRRQLELLKQLSAPFSTNDDAVNLVFCEGVSIISSRMLLSSWSLALEALLLHGNGLLGNSPREVRMNDVTVETFRAAIEFRCSGAVPDAQIDETDFEHALLSFSDCFSLQDLKDEYLYVAESKVQLQPSTARWHMSLAATANDSMRREKAWRVLSSDPVVLSEQFPQLSLADAKTILACDGLALPSGSEGHALALFSSWVLQRPERKVHAVELLESVRMCFLTVKELVDFQNVIDTQEQWAFARRDVLTAIASSMDAKLMGCCKRKRKHTVVDDGDAEQSDLKLMRAARHMFSKAEQDV